MKVNYQNNNNISFNGFYNNKGVKKILEFAADNGTLFGATTTLAFSTIRPLVILATPNTDKKNKQVASSKSIISSINGYMIALACSLPLAKSIKKIDANPTQFLKQETIKNLREGGKALTDSKAYSMATQLFKLGLGFVIAAPKAVLNAIGTPYVLQMFNNNNLYNPEEKNDGSQNPAFKGKDGLSRKIGQLIDKKNLQNFVNKYKDTNFPLHIVAATDTLSTGVFAHQIANNKNMQEEDKKPLIYNSIIATTLSIASTYLTDFLTKKQTDKFIEKFSQVNMNDAKLSKYIEGIKIAKPILIAGVIYYIIIPVISTFLADRVAYQKK